jgi:SAM-dependent methyltransferase
MASSFIPLSASAAASIAKNSLTPSDGVMRIQVSQTAHRINFINHWQIPPGSRVLELGCGQGDCTAVLAEAVGPEGHVDAVDPGSPDYGAPYTLAQAQDHLTKSPIGSRIGWHFADPRDFLRKTAGDGDEANWDVAVMAHCIWYFDKPDTLSEILRALQGRVKRVLIAEYALRATSPAAVPHILAAMTRAALEAHNPSSQANIRCMTSPKAIQALAGKEGWHLQTETALVPDAALSDGHWEAGSVEAVSDEQWEKEIAGAGITDARIVTMLNSSRDAVVNAIAALSGERTRTMDVWVASFTAQ